MYSYELLDKKLFLNSFGIDDPIKLLENPNYVLTSLKNLNNSINNNSKYNAYEEYKLDLIENYLLYLKSKKIRNFKEEKILQLYQQLYLKLFASGNISSLISSKIYKYRSYFFNEEELRENEYLFIKIKDKVEGIFQRFIKKEDIPLKELNYLFEYLTSCIESDDDYINEVSKSMIKYLLYSNNSYNLYAKKFLFSYLSHQYCKNNYYSDVHLYISDLDLTSNNKFRALGKFCFSNNILLINYNYVMKDYPNTLETYGVSNDVKVLHTLYHELEHYKQNNQRKDAVFLNSTNFILIKNAILHEYLSTKQSNEYYINYHDREIEKDANIEGWNSVYQLLKTYAPHRVNEINQCKINADILSFTSSVAIQKDIETNMEYELEIYNVKKIIDIIESHPKALKKYPIFKLFFHEDGRHKSLNELMDLYTKIKENNPIIDGYEIDPNVLIEFIKGITIIYGLKSFDLNIEDKKLVSWYSMVYELYLREADFIKEMCYIKELIDDKTFNRFIFLRMTYLDIYKDYLEKNYYKIKQLNEELFDFNLNNITLVHINDVYNKSKHLIKEIKGSDYTFK